MAKAHYQEPTGRIVAGVGKVAVPAELVVWPAGWIETTKYEPFLMDEQGAREVIAAFGALGVDLPVDYHHASIDPTQRLDGAAPAAGWITALRWDPARGLVASVNWTERAAGYIANREYRYHSPVGIVRNSDKRFIELVNVSLTNEPATINPKAIAAGRYAASGGHRIAAARPLRPIISKRGLNMLPERQEEQSVVAKLGGAEVIKIFKQTLFAIAAVARKADLLSLTELSGLFAPADLEALDVVLRKLSAMDTIGEGLDAPSGAPADSFSRNRDQVIAAGRAAFVLARRGRQTLVCSEAAWVNMALRDAGLPRMETPETSIRGIAIVAA